MRLSQGEFQRLEEEEEDDEWDGEEEELSKEEESPQPDDELSQQEQQQQQPVEPEQKRSATPPSSFKQRSSKADNRSKRISQVLDFDDTKASDESAKCVIQFSTAVFFCEESEGAFSIDIVRIGPASQEVSVQYSTEDGSARAGINFEEATGTVRFAPGEIMRTVTVPVRPSPIWSPTLDFSMKLDLPEGSLHAARLTTTHLHRSRCWIIHSGPFPSTAANDSSSRQLLVLEFFKTCWNNDVRASLTAAYAPFCSSNTLFLLSLHTNRSCATAP